jgi:hypothetical protein
MSRLTGLFFEPRSKMIWEQDVNEPDLLPFYLGFEVLLAVSYGNGYRNAYMIGTL